MITDLLSSRRRPPPGSLIPMVTSSNWNIFRVTGLLCGEFTGHHTKPVTGSFDAFFKLRLNKRLNEQSWGWWFETPSHSLWRHCNASRTCVHIWNKYRIMYELEWRTVYALTRWLLWCLFPELRSNEANKHRNNTRMSAWTARHDSTNILIFISYITQRIHKWRYNDNLHTSTPCVTCSIFILMMTSQSIADDVTMTRRSWRDHVDNDIY